MQQGTWKVNFLLLTLGAVSSIVYLLNFDLEDSLLRAYIPAERVDTMWSYQLQAAILFPVYFLAVILILRAPQEVHEKRKSGFIAIVVFALVYRAFIFPTKPLLSDDIYRYLWDGKVQRTAVNPYRYPPADEALAPLRAGDIYPHINRKTSPTIYPPGAQLIFLGGNLSGLKTALSFKFLIIGSDLISLYLLARLMRQLGLDERRLIIYAWNPLIIYELAGSGHAEGLMIPFFLAALLYSLRGAQGTASGMLAAASSIKLYPALLLPLFMRRRPLRSAAIFLGILAAVYLPYLGAGRSVLGFLPIYMRDPYEVFNLGLQGNFVDMFKGTGLGESLPKYTLLAGLAAFSGRAFFRKRAEGLNFIGAAYLVISAQLLFIYPAMHPWYLAWMIPILTIIPSAGWLYFSWALSLSYLKYASPSGIMPAWVVAVEYYPFYALLALEAVLRRRNIMAFLSRS